MRQHRLIRLSSTETARSVETCERCRVGIPTWAAAPASSVPVFSWKPRTSCWKMNWYTLQRLWLSGTRELGRRMRKGRDPQLHVVGTRSRAIRAHTSDEAGKDKSKNHLFTHMLL